jgi:hypothetical protein
MLIENPAARMIVATVLLLSACGGGGGDDGGAPPVPVATYSIGGTINGLAGSVTLQNNGGDNLTLNANGAFSFTTRVSAGGAYAVTVSSQPLGPDCAVTSGSGSATGNVSGVTVTCTVNPATRYVVLRANPPGSTDSTGLYVMSNKLVDRTPLRILTGNTDSIALLAEHTLDGGGTVTGARPGALVYRTLGLSGGDNLWSLDLAGSSNLVPRQIGNLLLGFGAGISVSQPELCNHKTILRNLRDPDSAMHVLTLSENPAVGCGSQLGGTIGTRRVVVLAADSATTAPRTITVSQGNMEPVYLANGMLSGILVVNIQTQTLEFFRDETFTNPTAVLNDVTDFMTVPNAQNQSHVWSDRGGKQTHAVLQVSDGSSSNLYRVSNAGTAQLLSDTSAAMDYPTLFGDDIFLYNRDLLVDPALISVVRVPVEGAGGPQTLWSYPQDTNCQGFFVHAVMGSRLVMVRNCFGPAPAGNTAQIATLSRDTPGTPIVWASYSGLIYDMGVAQDHVLVNLWNLVSGSSSPPAFHYSTEIRSSTGAVAQARAPGGFVPALSSPNGALIQIGGVTGSGFGNGALHQLTLGAPNPPSQTRLTNVDGSAYSLPAGTVDVSLISLDQNIAYGSIWNLDGARTDIAVDLQRGIVARPSVPGAELQVVTFDP